MAPKSRRSCFNALVYPKASAACQLLILVGIFGIERALKAWALGKRGPPFHLFRQGHWREKRVVTKSLASAAVLSLLVSACVMVEPEPEFQTDGDEIGVIDKMAMVPLPDLSDTFVLPQAPPTAESVVEERPNSSPPQVATPGVQEIRLLQERLRASGFDPGNADGIFGPKTREAWLRLESGCAMLEDLLAIAEMLHNAPDEPLHKIMPDTFLHQEEIRVVQVRLKDAGFDPGEIDGVVGPKTTSALMRLHSGCVLARNFSTSGSGALRYTDRSAGDLANQRSGVTRW